MDRNLVAEWEALLAAEGLAPVPLIAAKFRCGSPLPRRVQDDRPIQQRARAMLWAREDAAYYDLATAYYWRVDWSGHPRLHEAAWWLHASEGMSEREIASRLHTTRARIRYAIGVHVVLMRSPSEHE